MNTTLSYIISIMLGTLAGSLSGYNLIRQVSLQSLKPSRYVVVFSILRLGSLALISWYLLHWGPIPFILFGGSLMIAKWIVILALNE